MTNLLKSALLSTQDKGGISEISRENRILLIDPDQISTNSQPRGFFDDEEIKNLAETIKEVGIIQPLIVSIDGKAVELVAGERRLRAAKSIGLKKVPCIENNKDAFLIAVIENVQRKDLTAIEEAEAYQHLIDKFGYTQETLASYVGKKRTTISEILSINSLPREIKDQCRNSDKYTKNFLIQIVKSGPKEADMINAFRAAMDSGKTGQVLKQERNERRPRSSALHTARTKMRALSRQTQKLIKMELLPKEKEELKIEVQKLIAELAKLISIPD